MGHCQLICPLPLLKQIMPWRRDVCSPFASPSASPRASVEKLPLSTTTPGLEWEEKRKKPATKKSEQVILRRTYKRYLIATPPPVLVIHLKRFQQISKNNPYAAAFSSGFKKLDDVVAFPEYLDLAPYLAPKKEDEDDLELTASCASFTHRFTTSFAAGKRWYAETSAAEEMDEFLSTMAALKKRSTPWAMDGCVCAYDESLLRCAC